MRRDVWSNVARLAVVAVIVSTVGNSKTARAGWADRFFGEHAHDFGTVPRGAKVRYNFVLTNFLNEPLTIVDVRASCGCTTGRAATPVVPPGGTTTVEAEMDTRNFVGKKATTLFVTLMTAGGREAEVRLGVSSTILSDIVLNPGTVDFGTVARGRPAVQTLTIDRVGFPGWQVNRMVSTCRAIDATLNETHREGQSVGYLLKVTVRPDAPVGTFRDAIQLLSNDPETPAFPIQITLTVRGDLSASPGLLALGNVPSAGGARGRFLLRASKPFVVTAIDGQGDGFQAKADDDSAKPVHLVTVTFLPSPNTPRGDLRHAFRVNTDLTAEPPLELPVTLRIDP